MDLKIYVSILSEQGGKYKGCGMVAVYEKDGKVIVSQSFQSKEENIKSLKIIT